MAKTCEELVIEELESLRENNSGLLVIIENLENEIKRLAGQPDAGYTPHEVEAFKINEPIETVCLFVADEWDMKSDESDFEKMDVAEIRALMETDDGLRELAGKKRRYYRTKSCEVRHETFPYQIKYGMFTHAIEFTDNGKNMREVLVRGESENPSCDVYYATSMAGRLEDYGLELLKQRLAKYCDNREAREES